MVERGNHNPNVVGSSPTIIINILTEGSIVWFNASVLGTEDQRFESFSSENYKNMYQNIIIKKNYILINIHLIINKLIFILLILQILICILNFSYIFLNFFLETIKDLFMIYIENTYTLCQDQDLNITNQLIDELYNNLFSRLSNSSMQSAYISSSNSENSIMSIEMMNEEVEMMDEEEVSILLDTYVGIIEERLAINRYFYHLYNSSPLISINPCFFHIVNENLILESIRIQNDIELTLNNIHLDNIRRDGMFVAAEEYREIFQTLNFHIIQILKTVGISIDSYNTYIYNNNNINVRLLYNLFDFEPLNKLNNDLILLNIESFLTSNTISPIYFESIKNLTIFFDQTLDLLRLNMGLLDIIENNRIIDNNIGLDFTPRTHPTNPVVLNAQNINQLLFFYEPYMNVNNSDLLNFYRRPPFPNNLINKGFYIINRI